MFLGNESLDLQLTLMDSAQCFHWRHITSGFAAVVDSKAIYLQHGEDGLHARGQMTVKELRRYLDLDRDYASLAQEYGHISAARSAIECFPGLRILNQPPWEALVAFILSANNHVPRIRGLVERLSRELGESFELEGEKLWGFPRPEVLAECSEEELRALGVGYRAPYLIATARAVVDGFPLNQLCQMPYEEAHRTLTALKGVGDKVADCVLLFGCGQSSAFPVDVWVARLLKSWFGMEDASRREMARSARAMLGNHGGLLQQFLFHAARVGALKL